MNAKKLRRPKGVPKTTVSFNLRPAVYRRFRRFVGTGRVISEAVERALIREMEAAKEGAHGTV